MEIFICLIHFCQFVATFAIETIALILYIHLTLFSQQNYQHIDNNNIIKSNSK